MNRILLFLVLIVTLSCKEKNKVNTTQTEEKNKVALEKEVPVLKKLILPSHNLWSFNRLLFEKSKLKTDKSDSYNIKRASVNETAYATVNDIPVVFGSRYRLSIIAKKGSIGNLFAFRAVGEYPNRIDVVFDLKNGFVNGNKSSGDFITGKAIITPLQDGWFKCSIITEFETDMIKIIFGPTSGLRKTIAWEAKTNDFCDNYIIASSLTLEELSN